MSTAAIEYPFSGFVQWATRANIETARARWQPRLRTALLELCARASRDGYVQLSVGELAAHFGLHERQTWNVLRELRELGLVARETAKTALGRQAANRYQLLSDFVREQLARVHRSFDNLAPRITPPVYPDGSCIHQAPPACPDCLALAAPAP